MASLLLELVSPSLWWLWELVIVANVWMLKSFLPLITKDKAIFVEPDGTGGWNYLGERWVDRLKQSFRVRKGLSFFHDPAARLYRRGSSKVLLYNVRKARPINVVASDPQQVEGEDIKPLKVKTSETKHNPHPKKGEELSLNPNSDSFDDFVTEKAYEQGERANKTQKKDIAATLVYAVMAGLIGGLVGYLIGSQPHYPAATVGLVWSLVH